MFFFPEETLNEIIEALGALKSGTLRRSNFLIRVAAKVKRLSALNCMDRSRLPAVRMEQAVRRRRTRMRLISLSAERFSFRERRRVSAGLKAEA